MDLQQIIFSGIGKLLPDKKNLFDRRIKDTLYQIYLSDLFIDNNNPTVIYNPIISGLVISDIKLILINYKFKENKNEISSIDLENKIKLLKDKNQFKDIERIKTYLTNRFKEDLDIIAQEIALEYPNFRLFDLKSILPYKQLLIKKDLYKSLF
jgi:hypothetical protein